MGYSMIPLGGLVIGYVTELTTILLAMTIVCAIYALVIAGVLVSQRHIRRLTRADLSEVIN